jgi:hypothetical protein
MIIDWFCICSGESVDYLSHHCFVAREIRLFVFSLFVILWVGPKNMIQLLARLAREVWSSQGYSDLVCYSLLCNVDKEWEE